MIAKNLLPELSKRMEEIKDFKIQFDFMSQRIHVESILIDNNQKDIYLRGFSQGKDVKISNIQDLYLALQNSKAEISVYDLIGETSVSAEVGSDISHFIIESDIKTVVFSWLVDPETTNPNHISIEG